MGPCIINIFQYTSNKMQLYTVYLYLETALHVSGGTSTHHQESIQPLSTASGICHTVNATCRYRGRVGTGSSSSSTIAADSNNGVTNTRCWEIRVACAPDNGWGYHPKHVEQFPDINKVCKVASCWKYILVRM